MTRKKRKLPSKRQPEQEEDKKPRNLSPVRVVLAGATLIVLGMVGFYTIPGLITSDAGGNPFINSFYCSVMTLTTVGFGDICPGDVSDPLSDLFLLIFPLFGLGFFCGPILTMTSSWKSRVPGGVLSLGSLTLVLGVSILHLFEQMSIKDAIHLSVMTGTTIGYGNIAPSSDLGRFFLAIYAMMICNVAAGLLDEGRVYLESFCYHPFPSKKIKLKRKKE